MNPQTEKTHHTDHKMVVVEYRDGSYEECTECCYTRKLDEPQTEKTAMAGCGRCRALDLVVSELEAELADSDKELQLHRGRPDLLPVVEDLKSKLALAVSCLDEVQDALEGEELFDIEYDLITKTLTQIAGEKEGSK